MTTLTDVEIAQFIAEAFRAHGVHAACRSVSIAHRIGAHGQEEAALYIEIMASGPVRFAISVRSDGSLPG